MLSQKIKKIKNYWYLLTYLLFFHVSCNDINSLVDGFWAIDYLEFKGEYRMLELTSNIIIFKRNKVSLPSTFENYEDINQEKGFWRIEVEKQQYYIIFETENKYFSGKHKICFLKDHENKLIKMIVKSENLYFEATKGLFNFDKHNYLFDKYLCKD